MLPVDRPEFLEALEAGDTVRIDDGRVELRIIEATGTEATGRVPWGAGRISDRKGLALAGREVALPPRLLDADLELVQVALELGVGTLAVSYAAVPGILQATREAAAAASTGNGAPALVAKLEQPEALDAHRGHPGALRRPVALPGGPRRRGGARPAPARCSAASSTPPSAVPRSSWRGRSSTT